MIGPKVKREGNNDDEECYGNSTTSLRKQRVGCLKNQKASLDWVKKVAENDKSSLETQQKD